MKGLLVIAKGKKYCSLCKNEFTLVESEANALSSNVMANLWHRLLGHMSEKGLEALKMKKLVPNIKDTLVSHCNHCLVGKQHRTLFGRTITKKSRVIELVAYEGKII